MNYFIIYDNVISVMSTKENPPMVDSRFTEDDLADIFIFEIENGKKNQRNAS